MNRRLTTEEFIERAREVHGEKYDYSKVDYTTRDTKVTITCHEHGDFEQKPSHHISNKNRCPICAKLSKVSSFITYNSKNRDWDFEQPNEYKCIPLTKGKYALVDNEDFERCKDINWFVTNKGYARNNMNGLMHRYIMNCPDDMVVDHINHDTLDNRKSNLRIATKQQNSMYQKVQKINKTSIYKGVFWNKSKGKWISRIKKDGKNIYIGRYDSEEEAGLAYNQKALELFGEFAKLNIIE